MGLAMSITVAYLNLLRLLKTDEVQKLGVPARADEQSTANGLLRAA